MQTSTHTAPRPARRARPAAPKALPAYPLAQDPHFWVINWMCASLKAEAFQAYMDAWPKIGTAPVCAPRDPLRMAHYWAESLLHREAAACMRSALTDGHLLYAWHGSALFQPAAA